MIRLFVFIPMWIIFLCIKAPVAALGFVVIPRMWKYANTNYDDVPSRFRPWLNPEDWCGRVNTYENSLPEWWVDKHGSDEDSFYQYHAKRNPANGLRSYEWLDIDIVPAKVRYIHSENYDPLSTYEPDVLRGMDHPVNHVWYLAWIGVRAGFKIVHIWPDKKKDTNFWFFGKRTIEKGPRHLVIKFGWRVNPLHRIDENVTELEEDASFATKVLIYRKG